MSTLSNVETHQDPCIKLRLDAIPEAKNEATGVSVRYVPEPTKRWYVFRASYGREDLASEHIIADGTYAYIAKRQVRKIIDGNVRKATESLIPNLLFVYTTFEKAETYIKSTPKLHFLSYYLDHFTEDSNHKNPPLTVPSHEMENFILATQSGSEHIMVVSPNQCHFKSGETVLITNGAFKGVEGRVARVAGQQRVVVHLTNIGFVSTAYIPTAFIQKLDNQ